jgi:8-oxo-dGTP pyrophosphatase MutT (NUDIX family)
MPNIKKSYGIICCRPGSDGIQIMMVKKSTTYHFCEFVAGHYRKHNEAHLKKLFDNMTFHEKMDILSMKFQTMWYRIYRENPDKVYMQGTHNQWASSYIRKKNKFESTFIQDGGKRLKRLIENSINVDTEWEFPKGRKNNAIESDISAAIREFKEETNIDDDKFKILWRVKSYVSTYDDFGTTYQNKYFYADAIGDWEPQYKFYNKQQISEVSAVRWISTNDLMHMNLEEVTFNRLVRCFKKVIKKYKNSTKNARSNAKNIIGSRSTITNYTTVVSIPTINQPDPSLNVPKMNFVDISRRTYGSVVKGSMIHS